MGYIFQYDKRNGKTYVYEKVKKVNPKTGEVVNARKIIGRLDKETNTIVPTGRKGPKPRSTSQRKKSESVVPDYSTLYKETNIQLIKRNEEFQLLNEKYAMVSQKINRLEAIMEDCLRIIKS
ncbi:MAG: hypothetical protein IJ242_04905 [Clostridia bacterium]|nr:hypothetical protein [Clostridia bacterium]